ncbi:hypothetical protein GYMLUDRAFT_173296 [Collybiopsis luxurians FD-317 M1]|uniref:Cytochrome P450 n=1 Tax=Collybiopsis luxurians FD-317 M1 TaxID=944289 RepID=A0A0D0C495_9AGAR|nr:hypothetical protein GYMLUDRAFT_173296 [Collybiopsis luxurians FD-317 M1]
MLLQYTLTAIVLALGLWILSPTVLRKVVTDSDGNPLPPGPNRRFFSLRQYPERTVFAWAAKYGRLFSVWMGSQLFVVISDPRVARDLLVTNGAIFSSRRQYFLKNKIILKGRAITASEYGDTWRQHRKIAMQVLTAKAIEGFGQSLSYEARMLIHTLIDESQSGKVALNPYHYTARYALNNMLFISFGMRTNHKEDPLIERAVELALEFNKLTGPWSNPVDFFKPLEWLPTSKRTRAYKLHQNLIDVYGSMILRVKAKLDADQYVPDCLVKTIIQDQEREKLDWQDMVMLSAVFMLGGFFSASLTSPHSTASTAGLIQWFLALIPSHPEVALRAQEELDRVVGRDRLPTMEDEKHLHYIRAIIKEVQRVHSPFWMGTPHCTTEDFTYDGQFIPKGTAVILNCYSIHHNSDRYEDPWLFKPERYLGDDMTCAESAQQPNPLDRDHWTFGAGRRICPGIHAAERQLFLAISHLLWSFNFHSLPDEPISLEEYDGSSGRTPRPFKLKLSARHELVPSVLHGAQESTYWIL